MQDTEQIFCPLKNNNLRSNFITTTFGKLLSMTQYRLHYAIYLPLNAKDLTIDLPKHAYENRQKAINFAQVKNSNLLQALKLLMETKL